MKKCSLLPYTSEAYKPKRGQSQPRNANVSLQNSCFGFSPTLPPTPRLKERIEILTKLKLKWKTCFFSFRSFIGILDKVCITTLREDNQHYGCRMPMNQALLGVTIVVLLHNSLTHLSSLLPFRWEIPFLQTELGNKGLEQPRKHGELTI